MSNPNQLTRSVPFVNFRPIMQEEQEEKKEQPDIPTLERPVLRRQPAMYFPRRMPILNLP